MSGSVTRRSRPSGVGPTVGIQRMLANPRRGSQMRSSAISLFGPINSLFGEKFSLFRFEQGIDRKALKSLCD